MSNNQESDHLRAMESALHYYVLGPWSADHASRRDSAIRQLPYDRDRYPEQRIDTYITKVNALPAYLLPDRLLAVIIEQKLAASFGSAETARRMINSFRDRPSSRTDDTPLLTKIPALIDNGETIAMVDAHADFSGGIKLLAALSGALRSGKYLRRNHVIISNTMTREEINGKPVASHVKSVASAIWVNPDTPSFDELIQKQGLSEETASLIKEAGNEANRGAMRELKKARAKGGILQWAPFSSAVIRIHDDKKNLIRLKTPTLPSQAPGLLGRTRYALPVAYWEDYESGEVRWTIGELLDRDSIDIESRKIKEGIYLERTVGELCTMLAELSGVPVEHLGKVFEVAPHQIDASGLGNL